MWFSVDNYNYTCHVCAKEFWDSNFNEAVIEKVLSFHEMAPNFTRKSLNFKSIIEN